MCPTVRTLIPSVVAPRLRATGLPCIASPEIKSSGKTQQHGIETTALLMLADYISLILHRDTRPSSTHGAAGQYVHYLMNKAGASITQTTRQRKNDEVELHSIRTPTWSRPRREMHYDANRLA